MAFLCIVLCQAEKIFHKKNYKIEDEAQNRKNDNLLPFLQLHFVSALGKYLNIGPMS